MKNKKVFFCCVVGVLLNISLGNLNAQWQASGNNIYNTNSDNVGIGTTSPSEKLVIHKNSASQVATLYSNSTTLNNGLVVGIESTGNGFLWLRYNNFLYFGTNATERMRITANGNVGIGTSTPDYKLDVVGTIRAHSVLVNTLKTADFVFAPDYRLRPLAEVEQFIAANKHLPEIAPANEMIQNGVNMGEFQIQLLQKIEELTLYVIELKKENEAQQKEIEELKIKTNNQ